MRGKLIIPLLFLMLLVPGALGDISDSIGNAFDKIVSIGSLDWIGASDGSIVLGITRLLIWILMFAIFFAVITGLGGENGTAPFTFFTRAHAAIIAGVVATISAIYLPDVLLSTTGVGWATAVAFLLIGGPIAGIAALLILIPGEGNETRATIFVKIMLCVLLFYILSSMKLHLQGLGVI